MQRRNRAFRPGLPGSSDIELEVKLLCSNVSVHVMKRHKPALKKVHAKNVTPTMVVTSPRNYEGGQSQLLNGFKDVSYLTAPNLPAGKVAEVEGRVYPNYDQGHYNSALPNSLFVSRIYVAANGRNYDAVIAPDGKFVIHGVPTSPNLVIHVVGGAGIADGHERDQATNVLLDKITYQEGRVLHVLNYA
ncbi:MAG: hypothetical protein JWM56_22 [Candidatus Peribacteria bacterium]|nr:hypothetical protein [Candidatus Peribacteria bacterium]